MTWEYKIADDYSSMDVYDHTGAVVKTIQNDTAGFTVPDDVVSVMREEAKTARADGDTERWRDIHIRLATNDIAERE